MTLALAGALASGILGAFSSNKAAKAQQAAAAGQTALEGRIYDDTTARFNPYVQAGNNALAAYNFENGLGPRPTFGGDPLQVSQFSETIPGTGQGGTYYGNQGGMIRDPSNPDRWIMPGSQDTQRTGYRVGDQVFYDRAAADEYAAANATGGQEYQGYQATPGYNFQLQQGIGAIDSSAASRGNLFSGSTMKAAQTYGQGLAQQDYGNYLNRLQGMAQSGQNAAGNMATAGANYATGAGNALAASGNAQSAGYIGMGNALNTGIGNAIGVMNYQNMMKPQQPTWTPQQMAQVRAVL